MYCLKTIFSDIVCVHKKTFQSLQISNYQPPQCSFTYQVSNVPLEEQTNSFFLMFGQGIHIFEETKKSIQDDIGDLYCPTCPNEKCAYVSTNESSSFYD